jgi:PPM family protein phosphatase
METPAIVDVGLRTDPGRDPTKQINEDAVGHGETRHGHVAVVCDGMGGHEGGKEAAEQALAAILETFDKASQETPAHAVLKEAIENANLKVTALGASMSPAERPGSTVVAIVVHSGGTEVAHIGDSRAYAITAGRIAQITKDHSIVQEMVDRGLITPEEAKTHPDANRITRALGTRDTIDVDVRPTPLLHAAGDVFVLCSDGLSDMITPDDILRIATSASPEQAAGQLVDLANARGGHDNVSVLVIKTKDSAIARPGMVAKTVAQTIAEEAPLLLVTPAASGPRLPRAPMPSSPDSTSSPRRGLPLGVKLGVGLVVLGLIGAALAVYLNEKAEHRHTAPSASAFIAPTPAPTRTNVDLAPHAPMTAPESTTTEIEPLKPLSRPDGGAKAPD